MRVVIEMDLKKEILDFCSELGLDTVGFTKCRVFDEIKKFLEERKSAGLFNEFEEKDIDKRINPFLYMEKGRTIISIAFPYFFDSNSYADLKAHFSLYTLSRDYHNIVSEYLNKICDLIKANGYNAISFVDNNLLPERHIAKLCGIGEIGRNRMLITKEYGSYVFLGEIITDLDIECGNGLENIKNKYVTCKQCRQCENGCPSNCISEAFNNPNICLAYITQKKNIEDEWFNKFKGRMFGCDTCQKVCPHNLRVSTSPLLEFTPIEYMKDIDLKEIANINNKIFNQKYKIAAAGWRGKNILQRNALINVFENEHNKSINSQGQDINHLDINIQSVESPYIKDYYSRLLKYYNL